MMSNKHEEAQGGQEPWAVQDRHEGRVQGWYRIVEFVEDPEGPGLLVRFYSLEAGGIEEALSVVREGFDALDREERMSKEEARQLMDELEKQGYVWDDEGVILWKKGNNLS